VVEPLSENWADLSPQSPPDAGSHRERPPLQLRSVTSCARWSRRWSFRNARTKFGLTQIWRQCE